MGVIQIFVKNEKELKIIQLNNENVQKINELNSILKCL